ncbi:MAG: DUF2254 domain-containing protein [Bacteroidales bacterium]|nr:DUF2254 domain-containing protein [Bacteroidales bacterium]
MPAIISTGIFLMAIVINTSQKTVLGNELLKSLKFIQFESPDTVRSLLSALLAGTISLTVFSFTMVMVVVNQAASNYSPKVIDEFISKTVNQVILGIYIGTILFIIVSLTQIGDSDNFSEAPHFNAFGSIVLIVICIALFIVFIENISSSVRINNVIDRIFRQTKDALKKSTGETSDKKHEVKVWYPYYAKNSGYFQRIVKQNLLLILKDNQLIIRIKPYYGTYLLHNHILFYLNRKIENEGILNKIEDSFITYSGENIEENYFYGFRQLREVAVKALSPGINDPGISVICLDYLSELFSIYIALEKKTTLPMRMETYVFF